MVMKKTDLGLFPIDWSVSDWSSVLDGFTSGATPSRAIKDYFKGNIRWITSGELNYNIIIDTIEHISKDAVKRTNLTVHPPGTFLMAITGLEAEGTRGSCGIIGKESTTNQSCLAIYGTSRLMIPYLFYFYVKYGDWLAKHYCQGTKQQSYTASLVKRLPIIYPPSIEEQRCITEVLSDVDNLISSLQKLIKKKKAIKQGAMQELLTGKKRLPGFLGEWKHGVWKDVLAGFYSGATPYRGRADYYKGNIRWVSSGELNYNIIKDTIEHISEKAKSETSLIAHPAGTFLMAITGLEAAGTRGSCAILGKDATTNQSCMAIYGTDKMVIPYLYHYYLLNGEELAFQYCQGTKQQSYTAAIVKELPIYYPCDIVEQQAIAQVLSDMDSEIEQLEKKLVKYQQIKQGMMQELLTGRIRLVDADGKEQPKAQILQEKQSQPAHNQHFDDAVMIAGIVNAFYSEKYPLGRKKVQKLLYLVRRKEQADISAFHKKAAGPYADEVRYKGGEPIAQKNKYIQVKRNEKGSCFEKDVQMQQALTYLKDWGKQADVDWLVSQFQYTSVNELELLATVDMAICDLRREGKEISVASIKDLIRSNKEWRDKLKKAYFKDADIQRAIKHCQELFPDKEG